MSKETEQEFPRGITTAGRGVGTDDARKPAESGTTSSNQRDRANSFKVRTGQREFERGVREHRVCGLLARRQYGKTTTASRIALFKMAKKAGHSVVFGSVKLDLGREIVRKEAEALQKCFSLLAAQAEEAKLKLDAVEEKGKSVSAVGLDDWSDLYEHSRLEFRLYHSKSVYSRTKVVALTPDAVGETGDLILDEVGRVKNFRDVLEAVMPIIASHPDFRCIYTTTPPPDDSHPSFELLAPPIGANLPVKPEGNWYRSELGVWVLRITAEDAYADGIPLFDDDSGKPISPAESRAAAVDKDAWDRNYGCKFVLGGTSACGIQVLDVAQRRGMGQCALFQVYNDADMDTVCNWLLEHLTDGPVGLGWDLATTTSETSNPSGFSVLEQRGPELLLRAAVVWKTADPDVALERARRIIHTVRAREQGGPARRLAIDATNERYFALGVRKEFAADLPVELVIGSETIELPGQPEPITMKQYLGGLLVAELDDNRMSLPPERYLREDWRLVRKEKGQFVCEPDANGRHGDTFDGTKLARHALKSSSGAFTIETVKQVAWQLQSADSVFRLPPAPRL